MNHRLVRPALVPTVIAVALPCALIQWSVLAAGLSLLLSVVLIFLGMQVTREARRNAAFQATAVVALGWGQNCADHGGVQ
jgi:uncharacterized membrane protein YdbT with pleckstrin-like domain